MKEYAETIQEQELSSIRSFVQVVRTQNENNWLTLPWAHNLFVT